MTRGLLVAAAAVSALVALGGCSSDGERATVAPTSPPATTTATSVPVGPVPSAGCGADVVAQPGVSDRTMTSGGVERAFELQVPEGYDGVAPLPVVLGLHALTVSNKFVLSMAAGGMAEQYDFIGVAPSGLLDGSIPYWVAAPSDDNRDVAFISDLLDVVEAELCVDTARVYSTGMSNGGQMSSLLACRLAQRITAVAPVAGVEFSEECDGAPVPVIAFHGTADPFVTYEGGGLDAVRIADTYAWKGNVPAGVPQHLGVEDAMQNWAEHNGCGPEPVDEQVTAEVRKRTWRDCDAETILYTIERGGHTWPGRPVPGFEETFGRTTMDIDATDLMFEFFFADEA
jgi:polyhydroxybutyrate depolymerase